MVRFFIKLCLGLIILFTFTKCCIGYFGTFSNYKPSPGSLDRTYWQLISVKKKDLSYYISPNIDSGFIFTTYRWHNQLLCKIENGCELNINFDLNAFYEFTKDSCYRFYEHDNSDYNIYDSVQENIVMGLKRLRSYELNDSVLVLNNSEQISLKFKRISGPYKKSTKRYYYVGKVENLTKP